MYDIQAARHYLSTACLHERCEECRKVCKFCAALCTHSCHRFTGPGTFLHEKEQT